MSCLVELRKEKKDKNRAENSNFLANLKSLNEFIDYLCASKSQEKKEFQMQLSEQEVVRREKLTRLRELGINPYPANLYPVDHTSKHIKEKFENGKKVVIAGRLMAVKIQGKVSFAELQDAEGRIQVYFNRDEICPGDDKTKYNEIFKKLLDFGDFIGIEGELFTTKVGEKTVMVKDFSLLAKSLKPLPIPKEKNGVVYDAFTDPEQRYRQRYADLVVNPQVKEVFVKRTKLFNAMRSFFNDAGYFESRNSYFTTHTRRSSSKTFCYASQFSGHSPIHENCQRIIFKTIDCRWV